LSGQFCRAGSDGVFKFLDEFCAGFCEIGASTATTTGSRCGCFDGIASVQIFVFDERFADGGYEGYFAVNDSAEHECNGTVFIAQLIGEIAEGFAGDILQ
jgi:hypothetical protein